MLYYRRALPFFLFVFLILSLAACSAATIYVKTTGSDSNNGSSWDLAKKTIQAGINAAISGDQVWAAGGTYVERITAKTGVALYGGYSGSGTTRDIRAYVTTIDGGAGGSVITMPADANSGTIVDGFTIQNGLSAYGGGIYCKGSPVISHNVICQNNTYKVTGPPLTGGEGGGIYCDAGSPLIANNIIRGNYAPGATDGAGGGISCTTTGTATIESNLIASNNVYGVWSWGGTQTIVNNTFVGNEGVALAFYSTGTVANNIVAYNAAGVQYYYSAPTTYKNNCVYGNNRYDYSGWSTAPTGTNGNISADPRLASVTGQDVHLMLDSPCIGAGSNSAVQAGWTDIDGQDRILPSGGTVDIGADESDGSTPIVIARILRVTPTGSDGNDGSDWDDAHAKRTIQAAVNAGGTLPAEVWVKAGTYAETIALHQYAYVYGGFAGVEVARGERNWKLNQTIIDGRQFSYGFNLDTGAMCTTVDGFVIKNVKGYGVYCSCASPTIVNNVISGCYNSGIYCGNCSPLIANNAILGNSAVTGGGINLYYSSARIVNNTIIGNSAGDGGGIYISSYSYPTIANCIVANNTSGIWKTSQSDVYSPTLKNNCVYGNALYNYLNFSPVPTGTNGNISVDPKLVNPELGGFHIATDSPCIGAGTNTLLRPGWYDVDGQSRVLNSTVDIGADESDGTTPPAITPVVVRVTPTGNDANDGSAWDNAHAKRTLQAALDAASVQCGEVWAKAGMYNETIALRSYAPLYGGFAGTETVRTDRNWTNNKTVVDGQQGTISANVGYQTGGVDGCIVRNAYRLSAWGGSPVLANNVISGSSAMDDDGGINLYHGAPRVYNNFIAGFPYTAISCYKDSGTFVNNTIVGAKNCAFYVRSGSPVIANNIIAYSTNGIYSDGSSSTTPVIHHNCCYGNSINYWSCSGGTGAITTDPKIAGKEYGNLHIQAGSSCIGAGDDTLVTSIALDMDGQTRKQGTHVDIGADESNGTTTWTAGPYVAVKVTPTGNDANDGMGWDDSHAKRTVQAGIDTAAAYGGEVWVKAGAYTGMVTLKQFAYAYGGFAGTETSRLRRNWKANVAVIDAGAANTVVHGGGGYTYAGLDGFRLQNGIGYIIYSGSPQTKYGGGVCLYGSYPTIANCTIASCTATYGGGVYCKSGPGTISGCTITGNSATYGSGIQCDASDMLIYGNVISGNTGAGGQPAQGIRVETTCSPVMQNNIITGHVGSTSAAGIRLNAGSVKMNNNTIVGNYRGVDYASGTIWNLKNNIIAGNTIGVSGTAPTSGNMTNNDVYGSTSANYSGGVSAGAGDISLDPLFADSAGGNYHILAGSPCIDSGMSSTSTPAYDIEGCMRPQDGDGSGSAANDMGAYEYPLNLTAARASKSDGTTLAFGGFSVTGTIPGANCIYVESASRTLGIRVDTTSTFSEGEMVNVSGAIQTDSVTGERYMSPSGGYPASMGMMNVLKPLVMQSGVVGGEDSGLQKGITGGYGVNNIGLLVTVCGAVTGFDNPGSPASWFKIDDGSGFAAKVKVPTGVTISNTWTFVKVTGMSSLEKNGSNYDRVIRVRKQADIVPF